MSKENSHSYPVVISFYTGSGYYAQAAERLISDCQRLNLDYDIRKAPLKKTASWTDACRYKIKFIDRCQRRHKRPVMWVDVDTRLLARPQLLQDSKVDLAFWIRGITNFRDYDPGKWTRLMSPAILYFGYTSTTTEFLRLMKNLEKTYKGVATDDFFLQEAWVAFDKPMSLLILPPDLITLDKQKDKRAYFHIGLSGHSKPAKTQVRQHQSQPYSIQRRRSVFMHEAAQLSASGRQQDALLMYQYAFNADPSDVELAYTIARLWRERGQIKTAMDILEKIKGKDGPINHPQRFLADSEMLGGNLSKAEKILRDLIKKGMPMDAALAHSRLIRVQMEKRAQTLHLTHRQRPPLWWMEAPYPGNFGDMLNPYLIEKLSGKPPLFSPRDQSIIAIGSTIKFAGEDSHVWGSGTPRMSDRLNPKAHYHAVRGPLTRQLVLESGGKCPKVYGDPAWFLPQVYQPKSVKKSYKLGLIKHYTNEKDLRTTNSVKEISVIRAGYEGIEQFVDEINECEAILTTSLHGLIVSHAYGIPARWCEVTDTTSAIAGDGTKYHDYMMSVGLKPEPSLKLRKGTQINLSFAPKANRSPAKEIDLEALANAAPFEINTKWKRNAPIGREGQNIQTTDTYKHIHLAAPTEEISTYKRRIKQIDSKLLNDSLRKIHSRIKSR